MFSDILSDLPIFFIGTSLVTTASYAAATVLGKTPNWPQRLLRFLPWSFVSIAIASNTIQV